jgi:putative ABC transport system ATP-binding protein
MTSIITAEGVCKDYVTGPVRTAVLHEVAMSVPEGAFAVLVGPSGCGKSTLLNLIGALDTVDAGQLSVAGTALHRASSADLMRFRRTHTSFIFQYYQLLPTLTARENVEVVLEPSGLSNAEIQERGTSMLEAVGLADKHARFPGELSGGEQQRVAIARALAKRPTLMLADEPTGSLDRETGRQIIDLMKAQQQATGSTFFVVTHDPVVVEAGTHVFEMIDGQVAAR